MKIKNVNDIMIFCLEDMLFEDFLSELDKLLDETFFHNDCFYPKAFFDLNHRKINDHEIKELLLLLNKKEKVLFYGLSLNKQDEYILLNDDLIRNGDLIYVKQKTVFTNKINQGAHIYCFCDTYFIDEVKGNIVLMNEDIKIFVSKAMHATFMINNKMIYNVTSFSPLHIYYDGKEIVCEKGENDYESHHSVDFR